MPQLKIPSVKLPAMRDLREMSPEDVKDQLKHALQDVRVNDMKLTDIDLSHIELPKVEIPKVDKVDLSKVDLSKIDLPAAVIAAAEGAGLKRKRRSRTRFVLAGLVIAALGAVAVMNVAWLRYRFDDITRRIRQKADAGRVYDSLEDEEGDTYAEPVAVPVQADTYAQSYQSTADPTGTITEPGTSTTDSGEVARDGEVRLPGS
jgi:hypothetical protein